MNISKPIPYMTLVLNAVYNGNKTAYEIITYLKDFDLEGVKAYNAITNCRLQGYLDSNKIDGTRLLTYTLTDKGMMNLKPDKAKTKPPKLPHGTYTKEILEIVANNKIESKKDAQAKYNHDNFLNIFKYAINTGHILKENGMYRLTGKGTQRLHILDMQTNDIFECYASAHTCTNIRIAEIKSNITATTIAPVSVEHVALSAPVTAHSPKIRHSIAKLKYSVPISEPHFKFRSIHV